MPFQPHSRHTTASRCTERRNGTAGIGAPGNDVTLTLNSKIQQAAQDALSGYAGACVVMDPETGAVLGMASSPTYDAADFAVVPGYEHIFAAALLRRALIVLGVMLAVGLGL